MTTADLMPMLPELLLGGLAILLLMVGVFAGDGKTCGVTLAAKVGLIAAGVILFCNGPAVAPVMNGMFLNDEFARFVKIIILAGSALALCLTKPYLKERGMARPEYPVLVMLATLGMMLMVSAHDLLALYVGLELQSLSLYVLAAFNRDDRKSSEAGLKYFVLGGLASGLLLFGISLLYGVSGSTDFGALHNFFAASGSVTDLARAGLLFVLAGLAFKVSAAPFHMWAPDVYEGAPTPVTGFFAAAPKVAAMALLMRVLFVPLHGMIQDWQQAVSFIALASMLVGGFGAIVQSNIKRLMAYSAIAHAGYALVGLAAGNAEGVQGTLIYLGIYVLNVLGTFAAILSLRRGGVMLENIGDLAGLSRARPLLALALTVFMFSLAGAPPLAGFFGKFYVFMAAVHAGLYPLAIIGILTSAVAAFYYLKIVKLMYFDESAAAIDPAPEYGVRAVLVIAAVAMVGFILMPTPLIDGAGLAAAGLLH